MMLIIWFAGLIYLMFIYRLHGTRQSVVLNLDFLHMYSAAVGFSGMIGENQALRQILFNVLLYVPFGAIGGALTRKAWLTVSIGLCLSVLTEALQYWTGLGWTDVDDVISNGIGLMIGTFLFTIMRGKEVTSDNNKNIES